MPAPKIASLVSCRILRALLDCGALELPSGVTMAHLGAVIDQEIEASNGNRTVHLSVLEAGEYAAALREAAETLSKLAYCKGARDQAVKLRELAERFQPPEVPAGA